jgi:hypothetical protein
MKFLGAFYSADVCPRYMLITMSRRPQNTTTGIFKLETLAHRKSPSTPQVSHRFCNHEIGDCHQDSVDDWHRSQLTAEWLKEFGEALFVTRTGRELWQKLMDRKIDPVDILDCVALGVGCFATKEERAQIVDFTYEGEDDDGNPIFGEPIYDGSFITESEYAKGLAQARLLKPFLTKCLRKMIEMKAELETIKLRREGPLCVPNFEWPKEMEAYEATLKGIIPQLEALVAHYKPIAHASRKSKNHEGVLIAVDALRIRMGCDNSEVLRLLNAGYVASGKDELSEAELRDQVKSARQVFSEANL